MNLQTKQQGLTAVKNPVDLNKYEFATNLDAYMHPTESTLNIHLIDANFWRLRNIPKLSAYQIYSNLSIFSSNFSSLCLLLCEWLSM